MMNTAKKLMLLNMGGAGSSGAEAITYLFRDEFTTDEAAPATDPRTAEPGPGTWTMVGESDVSIVSSELQLTGTSAITITSSALTRATGLAVVSRVSRLTTGSDNRSYFGLISTSPALTVGGSLSVTSVFVDGAYNIENIITEDVWYNYAIVARDAGYLYFIDQVLVWVRDYGADASLPVVLTRGANRAHIGVDHVLAWQLAAPFTTDYGIATLNESSPADATAYTGDADGIIDLTVTAPGSLDGAPTTRCGFYYRADADLTPAWHCYVAGDGTFNLDSIASDGTRTNRITVAAVIAAGGTRTLRIIAAATTHNAYTLSSTTWTKRGAEITLSLNDAVTRIIPSVPAGWSIANLRSYPRTSTVYDALDPN